MIKGIEVNENKVKKLIKDIAALMDKSDVSLLEGLAALMILVETTKMENGIDFKCVKVDTMAHSSEAEQVPVKH